MASAWRFFVWFDGSNRLALKYCSDLHRKLMIGVFVLDGPFNDDVIDVEWRLSSFFEEDDGEVFVAFREGHQCGMMFIIRSDVFVVHFRVWKELEFIDRFEWSMDDWGAVLMFHMESYDVPSSEIWEEPYLFLVCFCGAVCNRV